MKFVAVGEINLFLGEYGKYIMAEPGAVLSVLNLEDGTYRFSRNVCNYQSTLRHFSEQRRSR